VNPNRGHLETDFSKCLSVSELSAMSRLHPHLLRASLSAPPSPHPSSVLCPPLFAPLSSLRPFGSGKSTEPAPWRRTWVVSERTVYRDVRDLVLSGVPVLGEAGVGYALPRGYDLPPLMFNEEEIEALVLGARVVQSWADPQLRDLFEHYQNEDRPR
jgi:hypothetical protein